MARSAIQTFGKYQILERIATGGMAEIYKARLEGIGGFQRTFAIKRILPHLSQNDEYVAMLVDEAKVAGLLSHANIVQILDLGQVDGVWFIAMEFVPGRDLGAVLKRAAAKGLSLPVPHAIFIVLELLKGLEYAHQRQVMRGGRPVPLNIIHRDISPPNILLSYQGEVKLTDFGIARASHKALETQAGVIKGRFDYMSPEQAEASRDLDQRSDLFSVGVVLYEMITGQHPFRTDSELTTLERIRAGDYPPVSQVNSSVPFSLETIIDRALRPDRTERFPSAMAFKEALDKFFYEAGFIFTQTTLANYMSGLYVDESMAGGPFRGTEEREFSEIEFDGEVPTSMIDQRELRMSLHDDEGLAGLGRLDSGLVPDRGPAPASEWADDQETVIKATPLASEIIPRVVAADEQETLIRSSPLMPDPSLFDVPLSEPPDPSDVSLSMPLDELEAELIATTPPRRSRLGRYGVALAFVTLFIGLCSGMLLGGSVGTALGIAVARSAPIVPPLAAPDGQLPAAPMPLE